MTIYLDIVFLENVLMNYLILYATGFVQKKKAKTLRLMLASCIGAIYAIVSYLGLIPIYSSMLMKILLSTIMIYVAFENQTLKKMLKNLLLFYLASFVIGGCALALLYMISPQNVMFQNGVLVGTYPMKVTLIAGIIGFTIIQISFSLNKRQMKAKDLICDLEIGINGKSVNLKAYMDSGNMLKDPLSKKPVVIVEKSKMEDIIKLDNIFSFKASEDSNKKEKYCHLSDKQNSYEITKELNSLNGELTNNIEIKEERGDEKLKFRLIPFKSIGKQNGMLIRSKARIHQSKL